jgi:Transposase IS66 family
VPVQMHDRRGENHQAYLWQYGKPGGETVFDFCLGRGREGPRKFLGEWEGILQTDGYSAYDDIGGLTILISNRFRVTQCVSRSSTGLVHSWLNWRSRLIPRTPNDRQPRILRKSWINLRERAQIENTTSIRPNQPHTQASFAKSHARTCVLRFPVGRHAPADSNH